MKINKIEFKKVVPCEKQIIDLYNLLILRKHKISHEEKPSFYDHEIFVKSKPYRFWYLIYSGQDALGSFYVSNENTIGINIIKNESLELISSILDMVKKKHSPLPPIKSIRGSFFSVNVPPSNNFLINSLKKSGAELAQVTFILNDGDHDLL
jgi:hypothetical protein